MLVTKVWRSQPGKYFCLSSKSRSGGWRDRFFTRLQFRLVKPFIEENLDKDLYWCPHGFEQRRRLKDYAVLPKLLWADLDEVSPSEIKPMPTIAWESSPGRYVGLWSLDTELEDEDINRRLTYSIGADLGGWDLTQVLRIPGTHNYKYPQAPRVKMLWEDGPLYTLEEIEGALPEAKKTEPSFGEAHKIFKRYQKRLTPFARRELLSGRPQRGKRSEVLWRLNKECLEAGMTTDEAFILLRVSPWNKFASRRNGDVQLRRELDKSMKEKFEAAPVEVKEEYEHEPFLTTSLEEIEEEQIDWIWYPYLARKEMTILEGDPGLGKSYLAQIFGAHIVDGRKLPTVKAHKPVKGKVVYFDIENSAGSVTKRRLKDNGCKNLSYYFQEEKFFMIDDDEALNDVYDALERVRPVLVVFDTINTYIGKADTHKASETQQALANFLEIAKRFNCAVVVIRHLTKSTREKALYRGQGNIAFTGFARVVITVGEHPEEQNTRVLAVTKLNITKRPLALTFTIEGLPDTLKAQDRSRFVWGDFVDLSSDDIITVSPAIKKRGTEVEDFLREVLDAGPMGKGELGRAAAARGITMKIVRRVADEIGVIKEIQGFGKRKRSVWKLPDGKA